MCTISNFSPKWICFLLVFVDSSIVPTITPYPEKLIDLNFHPLEVVSRYRDPQFQVGEKYLFVYFGTNICKF